MQPLNLDISRYKKEKPAPTPTHQICNEIYEYFDKQIPYKQLLGLCKYKGHHFIRETFYEFQKHSKVKTPAYFLGIINKTKTIWK